MIPLWLSCLRYATFPYVNECPELERWGHLRAQKVEICKKFLDKKSRLVAWGVTQ